MLTTQTRHELEARVFKVTDAAVAEGGPWAADISEQADTALEYLRSENALPQAAVGLVTALEGFARAGGLVVQTTAKRPTAKRPTVTPATPATPATSPATSPAPEVKQAALGAWWDGLGTPGKIALGVLVLAGAAWVWSSRH